MPRFPREVRRNTEHRWRRDDRLSQPGLPTITFHAPRALRLRPAESEVAGVGLAGIEADEFLLGGPADPVVDAAVLLTEVSAALEEHDVAGSASEHLDRILVGPAALALEGGLPF